MVICWFGTAIAAMPMVKWRLEPTAILRIGSDDAISRRGPDVDLNDVTNFILVNVVRQLSCLCKQSTEMFDELELLTGGIVRRAIRLTDRVKSLRSFTSELNPTVEEVCLDDIGAYKPYRSDASKQPSFSQQRPQGVVEVYLRGMSVPALEKLNRFRDDGEDCVRMYTNPDFFFEIWSSQIKKEMSEKKPKRKKRQAQKQVAVTVRAPKNVKQLALIDKVQRQNEATAVAVKPKPGTSDAVDPRSLTGQRRSSIPGNWPSSNDPPPQAPLDIKRRPSITDTSGHAPRVPPPPKGRVAQPATLPKTTCRPAVAPPPPPPPSPPVNPSGREVIQHNDLPPPPPPPPPTPPPTDSMPEGLDAIPSPPLPSPPPPILRNAAKNANRGTLYSVNNFNRKTAFFPSPPPPMISDALDSDAGNSSLPLPPPPPSPPATPPPPSDQIPPTPESAFQMRSATPSKTQPRESRSDLLSAIRIGITFRKVEATRTADKSKQSKGGLFDVQTILEMRRKALEEDSEEDEDDDVTDGDEWGE